MAQQAQLQGSHPIVGPSAMKARAAAAAAAQAPQAPQAPRPPQRQAPAPRRQVLAAPIRARAAAPPVYQQPPRAIPRRRLPPPTRPAAVAKTERVEPPAAPPPTPPAAPAAPLAPPEAPAEAAAGGGGGNPAGDENEIEVLVEVVKEEGLDTPVAEVTTGSPVSRRVRVLGGPADGWIVEGRLTAEGADEQAGRVGRSTRWSYQHPDGRNAFATFNGTAWSVEKHGDLLPAGLEQLRAVKEETRAILAERRAELVNAGKFT